MGMVEFQLREGGGSPRNTRGRSAIRPRMRQNCTRKAAYGGDFKIENLPRRKRTRRLTFI